MSGKSKSAQASLSQEAERRLQEQARERQEALEAEIQRCREETRRRREEEAQQLYERRRQEAQRALEDAETSLGAMRNNETVAKWSSGDLGRVTNTVEAIRHLAQTGAWGLVVLQAAQVLEQLQQIKTQALDRQSKEDERDHVVHSLVQVLQQIGFAVAGPALLHASDPDSDKVIQAVYTGLKAEGLFVHVPVNRSVTYHILGFPNESEATSAVIASTCEEAKEHLLRLHEALAQQPHGVQMGELTWAEPREPGPQEGGTSQPIVHENRHAGHSTSTAKGS